MHEVRLGQTIQDYLTGEDIKMTTYEDLRQGLAQLLVAEKGYPRANLKPKVPISFEIDGNIFTRKVDLVVYTREAVYAGRLLPGGPAPLVVVTDTKGACLLRTMDGKQLAAGCAAIPTWEELQALAAKHPAPVLDPERVPKEQRIFYMYSGLLAPSNAPSNEGCCAKTCAVTTG